VAGGSGTTKGMKIVKKSSNLAISKTCGDEKRMANEIREKGVESPDKKPGPAKGERA